MTTCAKNKHVHKKVCDVCRGKRYIGSEYECLDIQTGLMVTYRQPCPLCNADGADSKIIRPMKKHREKPNGNNKER